MDILKLVPQRRERLADQLYGQLLEQIVDGTLVEGSKLPTEQALCQLFGVSRPTVREALMRLHADGVVTTRHGSGTFVQRRPPGRLTSFAKVADMAGILRCMEVRIALEGSAASLAAQRHMPDGLARIRQALATLQAAFDAQLVPASADFDFHRAVAEASGNALFPEMLDTLHDTIAASMTVALGLTSVGTKERAARVIDEHRAIVEAIERGDAEVAGLSMRYHLHRARQRVTDRQRDL